MNELLQAVRELYPIWPITVAVDRAHEARIITMAEYRALQQYIYDHPEVIE